MSRFDIICFEGYRHDSFSSFNLLKLINRTKCNKANAAKFIMPWESFDLCDSLEEMEAETLERTK